MVHVCRRYMSQRAHMRPCALLKWKLVRQVVAVPSLLTQVADYIAKQNQEIDKLDIMLVEIGPNDVRPSHLVPLLLVTGTFLQGCEKLREELGREAWRYKGMRHAGVLAWALGWRTTHAYGSVWLLTLAACAGSTTEASNRAQAPVLWRWGSSDQVADAQVFGGLFGPAQIVDGDHDGFANQVVGAIWKALMALHSAGARRCAPLTEHMQGRR